jgi:hypothetical protein
LAAGLLALAGCGQQAGHIAQADAALPKDETSPAFLDRVASRPAVCENDAFRGILLLLEEADPAETFQQRVQELIDRQVLPADWDFAADRPITKGKLAYMLYQACNIRGGVTLTLVGPCQRYCLKELQFMGMLSAGLPGTEVTGLEFVAALNRADTYRQTGELPPIMASATE